MKREVIGWAWIAAATPLALMAAVGAGLYFVPRWGDVISPAGCVALLAASVLTGLWALFQVFAGWRRGSFRLLRAEAVAATVFGALDVLVPATLVLLLWLILRSLSHTRLMF